VRCLLRSVTAVALPLDLLAGFFVAWGAFYAPCRVLARMLLPAVRNSRSLPFHGAVEVYYTRCHSGLRTADRAFQHDRALPCLMFVVGCARRFARLMVAGCSS